MKNYSHVGEPVFEYAQKNPQHPAFVFSGQVLTYGDLEVQARQVAPRLKRLGVRKGMRVAILSGNTPNIMVIYFGLTLLGASIVPVNHEYGQNEIKYIVEHSEVNYFIYAELSKSLAENSNEISEFKTTLISMADLMGNLDLESLFDEALPGDVNDLALLCYTSGTTSKPKGVAATHGNELSSAFAYRDMWSVKDSDQLLVTLPLTFSYGFHAAAYVALISGATVLLSEKFHPRTALQAIEKQRPSIFLGVPTMYAMMADFASKENKKVDLSSLRLAAASGAALNYQTVEQCKDVLGIVVRPYYAMTEVRPIFCFDIHAAPDYKAGSAGKLVAPTEVRIVAEDGNDAEVGKTGELWVKGPSYSGGYFKDPERTKESMEGEWFKTGDLVNKDSDGYFYIVGRLRDQIISGGAKIAPIEVENTLLSLPGVEAAAVVGYPDPIFGQLVKAVLVKSDPSLSEEDVQSHCKELIAEYKVPRIVVFMDALPLAPSGKILKSALI